MYKYQASSTSLWHHVISLMYKLPTVFKPEKKLKNKKDHYHWPHKCGLHIEVWGVWAYLVPAPPLPKCEAETESKIF